MHPASCVSSTRLDSVEPLKLRPGRRRVDGAEVIDILTGMRRSKLPS